MGRYTQRRRAASGPATTAPTPPPSLHVLDVAAAGLGTVTVTFNQVVDFTTGGGTDPAFTFNGNTVNGVNLIPTSPSSTVSLTFPGSANTGDPWTLTGQPGWLVQTVLQPASGTIS